MVDDSTELVARAATTLIQVMAAPDESAWAMTREEFSSLFAKAAHVAASELDRSRAEVVGEPGLADEAVVEWQAKLRRLVRADPGAAVRMREALARVAAAAPRGQVSNTVTGNVTGTVVQAHTIHGGVGNSAYSGDHVDFSHGRFSGPVTGTHVEHHYEGTRVEQSHTSAGRDVIGVQNNHRDRDPDEKG
ncbi:hypothetical protein HUT17_04995 (plasmid) [Nocardiopsis flavescens]|nr:hypothetical protein HUT17_04995 [Nocardiopsis flavescens]